MSDLSLYWKSICGHYFWNDRLREISSYIGEREKRNCLLGWFGLLFMLAEIILDIGCPARLCCETAIL
jgi:hypothetical protein